MSRLVRFAGVGLVVIVAVVVVVVVATATQTTRPATTRPTTTTTCTPFNGVTGGGSTPGDAGNPHTCSQSSTTTTPTPTPPTTVPLPTSSDPGADFPYTSTCTELPRSKWDTSLGPDYAVPTFTVTITPTAAAPTNVGDYGFIGLGYEFLDSNGGVVASNFIPASGTVTPGNTATFTLEDDVPGSPPYNFPGPTCAVNQVNGAWSDPLP